ncbi:gamma-butyrobetaine hydroxylase family protein [Porticoccus sp.]
MTPSKIKLHREDGSLTLEYANGEHFTYSGEYLRVHSPSAEVRGHGKGQEVLQFGKKDVRVTAAKSAGNYALQITFSDGHDSGIYSWDYLRELADNYPEYWQRYLDALSAAGKFREADISTVKLMDPNASPQNK